MHVSLNSGQTASPGPDATWRGGRRGRRAAGKKVRMRCWCRYVFGFGCWRARLVQAGRRRDPHDLVDGCHGAVGDVPPKPPEPLGQPRLEGRQRVARGVVRPLEQHQRPRAVHLQLRKRLERRKYRRRGRSSSAGLSQLLSSAASHRKSNKRGARLLRPAKRSPACVRARSLLLAPPRWWGAPPRPPSRGTRCASSRSRGSPASATPSSRGPPASADSPCAAATASPGGRGPCTAEAPRTAARPWTRLWNRAGAQQTRGERRGTRSVQGPELEGTGALAGTKSGAAARR